MSSDAVQGALVGLILVWAVFATMVAAVMHGDQKELYKDAQRNGWGKYTLNERTGKIEFIWNEKASQ